MKEYFSKSILCVNDLLYKDSWFRQKIYHRTKNIYPKNTYIHTYAESIHKWCIEMLDFLKFVKMCLCGQKFQRISALVIDALLSSTPWKIRPQCAVSGNLLGSDFVFQGFSILYGYKIKAKLKLYNIL